MQKTYYPKAEEIQRDWVLVDANDQTLGRLVTQISTVLLGKHKPSFTPGVEMGDYVIVVNAARIKVTGNKLEDKKYWSYTGYSGGMKLTSLKTKMEKDPSFPLKNAVKGMLPHNKLGRRLLKKLRVYAGPEHPHAAQSPEVIDL